MNNNLNPSNNYWYWLALAGGVLVIWFVGLVILTVLGFLLSNAALKRVSQLQSATSSRVETKDHLLHHSYKAVITIAALYFYLSIPVLFFILIAAAWGIFNLWRGIISFTGEGVPNLPNQRMSIIGLLLPIAFSLLLVFTAFQMVVSVIIGLLTPKRKLIGRPLTREEASGMWSLVDGVARHLNTRTINKIFVRPEAFMAVSEQGFFLKRIFGRGTRLLFVGMGTLPGMTQGQFKSILAHEYSHFAHGDTTGGGLTFQVLVALQEITFALKASGLNNWYNPGWLFVNGFTFIFQFMTMGASRWQEVLADRRAILAYGSQDFIDGLNHVVYQDVLFDFQLHQEVENAVLEDRPLNNLYQLPPPEDKWKKEISIRIERANKNPTDPFDTHPTTTERIQLAQALNTKQPTEEDMRPVWELLPAEELQTEMTMYMQRKAQANIAQIIDRLDMRLGADWRKKKR